MNDVTAQTDTIDRQIARAERERELLDQAAVAPERRARALIRC